jgi:hypothetical protein
MQHFRVSRSDRIARSTLAATVLYAVAAVALTWPLAPRAARDVPGDLLDPLFSCWALGWNFHALGLSPVGPAATGYWDANIFYPTPRALARSEHFVPQALQGAIVYVVTGNLVLTYNLLFLSTFVLSGTFLYLLARDETGDAWAALAAGFLYAFALVRWTQIEHLGALSSQWMPLALLLVRRVARATGTRVAAAGIAALGIVTALQVTSSGYYLLFFPPFLALWAVIEARRAGGIVPWLRLAAAAAIAAACALPLVLPYVALQATGANRDLKSVVENSADLLSWVTAPERTRIWGPVLDAFPRGEARLFPGVITPLLVAAGLVGAIQAARARSQSTEPPAESRPMLRRMCRVAGPVLVAAAVVAAVGTVAGGWFARLGPFELRVVGMGRPLLLLAAGLAAILAGWPRLRARLAALVRRPEVVPIAFAMIAAWLSLGPLVTLRGWPVPIPSAYRWLYEFVPGFSAGRSPARFAMIAACFAALAAAWGLRHLRGTPAGRRAGWALCAAFLVETAAVPLPLSLQWEIEGVSALPEWRGGAPTPIVEAIRALPDDAVLAVLPFGEIFHEARAMFDSTAHWRRLLNGYSSWAPPEYTQVAFAVRDPLRRAPEVLAALRAAGATHVVVHEAGWVRDKGPQVTERLIDAGARPVARAGDVALLAVR